MRAVTKGIFATSSNLSVTCTGTAGRKLLLCIYLGQTEPRTMLDGAGNQYGFGLFKNSPRPLPWTALNSTSPSPAAINMTLNSSGTATQTIPVYSATLITPYLPGGTYTAMPETLFGVAYDATSCAQVSYGIDAAKFNNLQVSANVQSSCQLAITNVAFGNKSPLRSVVTARGYVRLTCSAGIPVAVSLGPGLSGSTDPTKRLMTGPNGTVSYGLYQDSANTIGWGDQPTNDYELAAAPAADLTLTVYARVPVQNVPPGSYADQVLVTVTY